MNVHSINNPDRPIVRFLSQTPETEVIMQAARFAWGDGDPAALRYLLRAGINWRSFDVLAEGCRIDPLLKRAFESVQWESVPLAIRQRLEQSSRFVAIRNMQLSQIGYELIQTMKAAGIELLPYKGPLWAAALYGNIGLRQIADLDFLVRREKLPEVAAILHDKGYVLNGMAERARLEREVDSKSDYALHCMHPSQPVLIEVHWRVMPPYSSFRLRPEFYRDWLHAEKGFGGISPGFTPEGVFLLFCLHNEKHTWHNLRFLIDAACLLNVQSTLDWDWIRQEANGLDRLSSVAITLMVLKGIMRKSLPQPAEQIVREHPAVLGQVAMIYCRLVRPGFRLPQYREWRMAFQRVSENLGFHEPHRMSRGRYVVELARPEYVDRRHLPPLPGAAACVFRITRLMRFIKFHLWRQYHSAHTAHVLRRRKEVEP